MAQKRRLKGLAALLLAAMLLTLPASATWGEADTEVSTQGDDYVSADDAEAQRQQEIEEANQQKQQREQQKQEYQGQINSLQGELDKLKQEQKELQSKLNDVSGKKNRRRQ